MIWTSFETAMKAMTFLGVLLWAALLTRPAPWRGAHWAGLAGGAAGVALMVGNRALAASWGGVLVDGLYLGLAAAWVVREVRRARRLARAPAEPAPGGGART